MEAEGCEWKQQYLRDAQFVFSHVQHHVHKKDKDGNYVPLNACARKQHRRSKKLKVNCKCKAEFPKDNVITTQTVLICQGLAKKFKLRVTGRRREQQGGRKEYLSGTLCISAAQTLLVLLVSLHTVHRMAKLSE